MAGSVEIYLATLVPQLRAQGTGVFSKDTKVCCGPYRAHARRPLRLSGSRRRVWRHAVPRQAEDVLVNPTVIVEVLSPSTEAFDRGEKFRRYRRWLPTLTDYVLVAQDQR